MRGPPSLSHSIPHPSHSIPLTTSHTPSLTPHATSLSPPLTLHPSPLTLHPSHHLAHSIPHPSHYIHQILHASSPPPPPLLRTFDWLEERRSGRRTKLPAKQFIDTALSQIQKHFQNEDIFPTKFGKPIAFSGDHVTSQ